MPMGSRAAMKELSRLSTNTNENMPSSMLTASSPTSSYCKQNTHLYIECSSRVIIKTTYLSIHHVGDISSHPTWCSIKTFTKSIHRQGHASRIRGKLDHIAIIWTAIFGWCMWLDVDLRTDTKKASCVSKWLDYVFKYANYSRLHRHHDQGLIWPLNEPKNLHFDNESDIHMSSKNYEANGYGQDLDLPIMSL